MFTFLNFHQNMKPHSFLQKKSLWKWIGPKKKVHQKTWIAFNFIWEFPLKYFGRRVTDSKPASDLLPPWLRVKKSESEKSEKLCILGPLNFLIFWYVEGGVLGNNISIKKCRTTFLWVLNFGQAPEFPNNFQNPTTGMTFFKMSHTWRS